MNRLYSCLMGVVALMVFAVGTADLSAQYCRPRLQDGWWGNGITLFQFNTFQNFSGTSDYNSQDGYFIFPDRRIDIPRNVENTFRIETNAWGPGTAAIWLDMNQDGIFGPEERVFSGTSFNQLLWTGTIVVPCSANVGLTRLRVIMYTNSVTEPSDPCVFPQQVGGECEDYIVDIVGDYTGSFPSEVSDAQSILAKGNLYDGSSPALPKPSVTLRVGQPNQSFNIQYRLIGPLPLTDTVYRADFSAVGPSGGSFPQFVTFEVPGATGPLASVGGILNTIPAVGGEYTMYSRLVGTNSACVAEYRQAFTIAADRDLSVRQIRSPQDNSAPKNFRYPNTTPIPVEAIFQNVGLTRIESFRGIAKLWNPNGTLVYTDTVVVNEPLNARARLTQMFKNFTATGAVGHTVGVYTAQVCGELIDPTPDMTPFNDCAPRPGFPTWKFEVAYNDEPGVNSVSVPTSTQRLIANRPFRPEAIFENNGIQDLSNVPVRLIITKMPGGVPVYNQQGIIQDIASGQFNKSIYTFPAFTPTEGGDYRFCFRVEYPGDPVETNNEICVTRTVIGNLSGIYTIGVSKPGPRNYTTIDAALDDLYLKGVSGPVTFEFTDATYNVTRVGISIPAIDLSSRIVGVSAVNTLTFKPSLDRSLTRGAVTINMTTESGVGILLGQNVAPANPNALQRQLYFSNQVNANSAGYITIDGGSQRSIRLAVRKTTVSAFPSPFMSAVYLSSGSSNIQIRNLLIEHQTGVVPSYASSLPVVQYNGGSQQFRFDPNTRNNTISYTAGITQRDTINPDNLGNLDTLINQNNKFIGNEINGFGYGIASMGMGALIKAGVNEFRPYYNSGTEITGNLIYNVRRAGIFVGYEDGVKITNNRIYNVGVAATGGTEADVAGIIAGGETRYNNIDLWISGNEISGVRGTNSSRGIVVEQAVNDFQSILQAGGTVVFPNRPEHTMVVSNAIWGISRSTTGGDMAGVHLLTRRATAGDRVTPFSTVYFTRQDTVANNTIVIPNDNIVGTGAIAGVASQHGNGTAILNNAIALQGASNAASYSHAVIFYEGTLFRGGSMNTDYLPASAPAALVSNRNAFNAPNASVARFIEISHTSELISSGSQDEFKNIRQWRSWTKQDINSVLGDFLAEHEYQGVAPNQKLRVKITPQPPLGSILNNRGERIASITTDIDGTPRGEAGLGYDIGADEFNGRLYVSDIEVVDILSPTAYRRTTGATSDAEYIMTKAPIDVTARLRNNGALAQTNVSVRVRVFLETVASNNAQLATPAFGTTPVVERTIKVDLNSNEFKNLSFGIPNWTPQTYFGLTGYTVPTRFSTMSANVTPRYMVEVTTQSDEFNPNNTQTKTLRFYLRKSQMEIIVSSRGTTSDILAGTPAQNDIAGHLNSDSLVKALGDLGFVNNPAANLYAYDVFERNAWEDRAVDYTLYRTMFWSHDLAPLTRTERDDIRNFVNAGRPGQKKNLAMGSQVPPRAHIGLTVNNDEVFVRRVLRAQYQAPGAPASPNYNLKRIIGQANARNTEETIVRTGFTNDAEPNPALIRIYSDAQTSGLANMAYSYKKGDRTTVDSIMGSSVAGLNLNSVYLGVDWRHYARPAVRTGLERVLRGIIDFFESNGGTVVPVELVAFDAKARGHNVDVFWATASEENSAYFVIERASVSPAGNSAYSVVSTNPAAGNSTGRRDYRVVDENVAAGTYAYRLTSVDKDGSRMQTSDVQVTIADEANALWLGDVTPNPVASTATVSYNLVSEGNVELVLYDASGAQVMTMANVPTGAGRHEVNLSVENLPAGSYRLVLRSNGVMATKNVTVVK